MKPYTIIIIVFLNVVFVSGIHSQNCKKFHLYSTCMQYVSPSYKIDGQSRSNVVGYGDKLTYNVIFYGERDYKVFLCATDLFYPIKYVFTDETTKQVIYDNLTDKYTDPIDLKIETTRRIIVEIKVLAKYASQEVIDNYFGCVGFLMYWKPEAD